MTPKTIYDIILLVAMGRVTFRDRFICLKFRVLRACKIGRIAQLGEHLPYKQGVTGSSPVATTIHMGV